MKYVIIFRRKCYTRRKVNLGKFDPRSDEGTFFKYLTKGRAYRCYNLRLKKLVKSANVKVDERF